ncbi:soluble lytic murein transglycosylase [Chelatococcus caeni]|uniref:Soluble lytic murein transglycosylase n=1 Tax=Chelatococcus caeni TaxID=1348468 RepID=A0A840BST0_9HYPH|nr:lytic transglycosylase domain-containing protein [Chelatococcus caeni]MBB4015643.1 soluble lytic murein transglycosylase [Chelatococcus caeni]
MKPFTRFLAASTALGLVGAVVLTVAVQRPSRAAVLPPPRPESTATPVSLPDPPARPENEAAQSPAPSPLLTLDETIKLYRAGRIGDGDALARSLETPAARTLAEWVALRHNARALAFERINTFLNRHPGWPGEDGLQKRAEQALLEEAKPARVVRGFFATREPVSPEGQIALAEMLAAEGHDSDAAEIARRVWRREAMSDALEKRINARFGSELLRSDHERRLERLLFAERLVEALPEAKALGPGHEALLKAFGAAMKNPAGAGKLLDAVPAALRSTPAYVFARARMLRRQDKLPEAAKALEDAPRVVAALADGDSWALERRILARGLLDAGDARAAYAVARVNEAESETAKIENAFFAGFIALRFLNEPERAAAHFAEAAPAATLPISVSRVAYWRGRTAEAAGRAEEARRFYQEAARHGTAYYGQLARHRLGEAEVPAHAAALPDPAARARAEAEPLIGALRLAYRLGDASLSVPLLAQAARTARDAETFAVLAEIAAQANDARGRLLVGKRALYAGHLLHAEAFPTDGVPPVDDAGAVERAMVLAIARQESAFEPGAISPAGARGLMQLMPATARETAKRAGLAFDLNRLTADPAYNATLGTAHLGELVGYWRGSYILTFAAYNAGPGNVRRWIAAYGDPRSPGVDPVDWVERIPFNETRNYVQRVMENLQVYRERVDGRTALLIDEDLRRGAN